MPIQLPTLSRIGPDDPSVGRIEAHAPDAQRDMVSTEAAFQGAAGDAIKYRNEMATQQAISTAHAQTNAMEQWHDEQFNGNPDKGLIGLKDQQGDPVQLYHDFEDRADAKMKELSSAPEGQSWSQETQNAVNTLLGRKAEELRHTMFTAYGAQKSKYDTETTTSTVKINQDAMPEATGHIDPTDTSGPGGSNSTMLPFQQRLNNINDAVITNAVAYGAAKEDPNGKYSYNKPDPNNPGQMMRVGVTLGPNTEQSLLKARGDGIYQAMDNLAKLGASDPSALAKAQALKDSYGDQLGASRVGQMDETMQKSQINLTTTSFAQKTMGMSPQQIKVEIAKLPQADQGEALKKLADNRRYMQDIEKQREDTNYQVGYQGAAALLKSQPAMTWSMAQNDPRIQTALQYGNPQQKSALEGMFNPPKQSDQAATSRMIDLISGSDKTYKDLTNIPDADMNLIKAGLNPAARKKLDDAVLKEKMMATMGVHGQDQQLMTLTRQKLIDSGAIQLDDNGKPDPRSTDGAAKLDKLLDDASNGFSNIKYRLGYSEQRAEAAKYAASVIKGGAAYVPPKLQVTGPAFGNSQPPPSAPAPKTQQQINKKAIGLWLQDPNNKGVPSQPVLNKFIQDHPEVTQ